MAGTGRRPSDTGLNRKPSAPKLSLSGEPASFKNFFVILLMYLCKKILLVNTTIKLGIYLFGTSALALFFDLLPFPSTYFARKDNFLNEYFVKLGWGWTLSLLIPFVYFTSSVYCGPKKLMVRQHMSRLAVATFFWYICTKLFNYIENATGICSSAEMEHDSKKLCREAGSDWIGFDISGHAFLLIHCLLVISEEVKCIEDWGKLKEIIKKEEETPTRPISREDLAKMKETYENHTPKIKCLIVGITLLQLVWEVMLVSTIIYFHNMPQKLIGSGFAAGVWLITYQVWYKVDTVLTIEPGKSVIRYCKSL